MSKTESKTTKSVATELKTCSVCGALPCDQATKPLFDMPDSIRHHGIDIIASIEQTIRSAYWRGVADGKRDVLNAKRI